MFTVGAYSIRVGLDGATTLVTELKYELKLILLGFNVPFIVNALVPFVTPTKEVAVNVGILIKKYAFNLVKLNTLLFTAVTLEKVRSTKAVVFVLL